MITMSNYYYTNFTPPFQPPSSAASRAALEAAGGGSAGNSEIGNSEKRPEIRASGGPNGGHLTVEDLNGSMRSYVSGNQPGISGKQQGVMGGNLYFPRDGSGHGHDETAGEHKHMVTPAQVRLVIGLFVCLLHHVISL